MLSHRVCGIINHLHTQNENLVILNLAVGTELMVNYATSLPIEHYPNLLPFSPFPILNPLSN